MPRSSVSSSSAVVLVVDPDPMNQRRMRDRLVRLGYAARTADDYESAQAIVEATPPDIVLVMGSAQDQDQEKAQGWETLSAKLSTWGIPVVRLAPIAGQVKDTEVVYVSDNDLKMRVDAALLTRKTQDALIVENSRLAAEHLYDSLTGLYNRRYILIRVEQEVRRCVRYDHPLSCFLLDIDKFSKVNETWGHAVGDSVLRDMAHVVTRTLRSTDVIARYRDDQFIGLLTDTSATGAQVAANRLRDAVAEHSFFNPEAPDAMKLTASVGIAYWEPATRPGEGTWEPQLIALAERALRAAKLSGTNRLVMLQAA
jgi:diguanylate cyclase (GGDEF)-like protein